MTSQDKAYTICICTIVVGIFAMMMTAIIVDGMTKGVFCG